VATPPLNEDFLDLLAALLAEGTRFLIVGAHAMAVHGVVRATGDLDVWVSPEVGNANRAWSALLRFGAPVQSLGFEPGDLERRDQILQIGVPPRRIDILTSISGVEFAEAWNGRVERTLGELAVPFLGREALVRNKRSAGRAKDLADLEALGAQAE
jgi:hypothetical protein